MTPAERARVILLPDYERPIREVITQHAIAYLASVVAQFPASRGIFPSLYHASRSDRPALVEVGHFCGWVISDSWPWLEFARQFVDHHWGEIYAIAAALNERGELKSAECVEIAAAPPRA